MLPTPEPFRHLLRRTTTTTILDPFPALSLPMGSPVASFSTRAGDAGEASTTGSQSAPPTGGPKQPMWYRFRTALTTLLVLNALVVGYTLFKSPSNPSEETPETATEGKEDGSSAQKEGKKEVSGTKIVFPDSSKVVLGTSPEVVSHEISKSKISSEDQLEIFRWMLAEKRKVKPASKAEKAQLDADKALLKEYLRRKTVLIS